MRLNHPWYWAAKNAWFVEVGDQRHPLGKHPEGEPSPRKRKKGDPPPMPPEAIMQAYYRLMTTSSRKLPEAEILRVCQVCDLFLDYSQKHHTPDTYRGYKDFLQDFCEMYGTLLGKDLKPLHVTRWLDANPGWNGSRRNAIVAVKRAFNWADAEGLLQPNPVKSVIGQLDLIEVAGLAPVPARMTGQEGSGMLASFRQGLDRAASDRHLTQREECPLRLLPQMEDCAASIEELLVRAARAKGSGNSGCRERVRNGQFERCPASRAFPPDDRHREPSVDNLERTKRSGAAARSGGRAREPGIDFLGKKSDTG